MTMHAPEQKRPVMRRYIARGRRIGILVATSAAMMACSAREPVTAVSPPAGEETRIGQAHVTQTDGTTIVLESAYIRSDSILGRERLPGTRGRFQDTALSLESVETIERQVVDPNRVLMVAGGIVLFVWLFAMSMEGAAAGGLTSP